jgi:hypothetical protein
MAGYQKSGNKSENVQRVTQKPAKWECGEAQGKNCQLVVATEMM